MAFDWAEAAAQRLSSPYTALEDVANLSDVDIDRAFDTYYSPLHQITALLTPASRQAMPRIDAKGVEENVRYTPSASEPLPQLGGTDARGATPRSASEQERELFPGLPTE